MTDLFLKIVNMSISASYIILAVVIARLLLKKAPKWITVLLWGIVAVRLVFPFSIESILSLIPKKETVSPEIMMMREPVIDSGIPVVNEVVNPVIQQSFTPEPIASANPLQIIIPIISVVWLVGVVAMVIYAFVSYWVLRKRIGPAFKLRDNIYQSENIKSPFVMGVIRPKIYLPFNTTEHNTEFFIAHERAHIKRLDHLWKPLGFTLLAVYWFNPLMWVAYVLLCKDIELACDEKVIANYDHVQRADYSQALLSCSMNRKLITACPIAFGEVSVKDRIKSVLSYKKPALWIIIIAIIAIIVTAVCFLTDPVSKEETPNTDVEQETNESEYKFEMPSEELQKQFVEEYISFQNYDPNNLRTVKIEHWLGSYGDLRFLVIHDENLNYHDGRMTFTIAGYRFEFPEGSAIIQVWVNQEFISMYEAYEQGIITAEMVAKIAEVCKQEQYIEVYLEEKEPPAKELLEYTLLEDGTYAVSAVTDKSCKEVVIPSEYNGKKVTAIGDSAFSKCERLTSITIPNSIKTIGNSAFYECKSLTGIAIPNSVTTIGDSAFSRCVYLNNVTIPGSVKTIGRYAFKDCSSLKSIVIPEGVTTIGDSAFYACAVLSSVTIPGTVKTTGDYTFYMCSNLRNVTISEGVKTIGNSAFSLCPSLTTITIPEGVTTIGNSAFFSCKYLSNITIPGTVKTIGEAAFYACSYLANIAIPDSVTEIGYSAFDTCLSLSSIYFSGTVAQWNTVKKGSSWASRVPATQVVCSNGEVALGE